MEETVLKRFSDMEYNHYDKHKHVGTTFYIQFHNQLVFQVTQLVLELND